MPNRILKDSIRTNKKINALSDFQFRVWAYLITYVDDFGRGSAETDIIKGFVFPRRKGITEANIRDALNGLASIGLIEIYTVDDESYLWFPGWADHQTTRAAKSKFPAPPENCKHLQADAYSCEQMNANVPEYDIRNTLNDNRYSIHDQSEGAANCVPDGFNDFWSVYPRKVSRQSAIKAWKAAKVDDALLTTIINDVKRRCATEWKGAELQFIPHPSTYLNQRRWEDETAPVERTNRGERNQSTNPALDYQQREYKDENFGDNFFLDLDAYAAKEG